MQITQLKKKILELFVTSTEDPIYAIKSDIPPEVFGAFGSYFSRNPQDFREHLWDAITGQIQDERTEFSPDSLEWLIQENLKKPSDAIKKGLAKSRRFFERWYGKYGHKSIANMVWIPMVATNVSQQFARELAYDQLAFFIEQSTRFVKFDTRNMLIDRDIINGPNANVYVSALETLSNAYQELTKRLTQKNKEKLPFEKWLKSQDSKSKKEDIKILQARYCQQIEGKTFDATRSLLPQAIKTNIAWILDARSTEFNIAAWKEHPLYEMRIAARLIEKHAGQIAPSILKYTSPNKYFGDKLRNYGGELPKIQTKPFNKGVEIISADPDALNKTLAYILKRHNRGGTWRQYYQFVSRMQFKEKISLLKRITQKREKHDQTIGMDEEADSVNIAFSIKTDLGAARDWRRHQSWERVEGIPTLDNGHMRPKEIDGLGQEAIDLYESAILKAHEAEKIIRESLPHQAVYVIPMAAYHEITFSGGLDNLQYLLFTRTTPFANPSYREDAFNLAEAVTRVHPWLLGYKEYPTGKNFMEVYQEAPLKGLMLVQTEDLKLHK